MSEPVLEVDSLSKRFGGFVALDAVSLHVGHGERVGLIGPNGSGKTTLINCISGALPCDDGRVVFDGHDVTRVPAYRRVRRGLTRSFQIPRPFRKLSLLENVALAAFYGREEHPSREEAWKRAKEALDLVIAHGTPPATQVLLRLGQPLQAVDRRA